ncbi:alpha/beta hydrolase family protein [Achromobacter deleyi]|uniref:alpha/beta hydrolase family protein n=1 Tax=Achromobacter deleyi TaxID=1353891 RepID=UPI001492E8BB|nr:hypothetical protein [Achromobacter deleyi]QVQ27364.1 hypothetical protein HLG70_02610 [Achromobacter deleyi]UIP22959.1 hypothetical protein LYZ39_10715 [Achromobacter deleyi]
MNFNRRRKKWLGKSDVVVVVCTLFAIYWAISSNTKPPIYPVEAFFALSPRTDFQISSDGKWLGFLESGFDADGNAFRGLYVQSITAGVPDGVARKISDERDGAIKGYVWKGASTVVVHKEAAAGNRSTMVAIDLRDGRAVNLAWSEGGSLRLQSTLRHDPYRILISRYAQAEGVSTLLRVDVRDGQCAEVATLQDNVIAWVEGGDGLVRTAISRTDFGTRVYSQAKDDAFHKVLEVGSGTTFRPIRYAADNESLYVLSNRFSDKIALVKWNPRMPDAEEPIFVLESADVESAAYSEALQQIDTASYRNFRPARSFFDETTERHYRKLREKLAGPELMLSGSNEDKTLYVVRTSGERDPGSEYLFHGYSETLTKLTVDSDRVPPMALAAVAPVTYAGRDGLSLEGYLTLPVGIEAKGLPCIVMPPGVPRARDRRKYDPVVQLFANRGYCVMQMNYRETVGLGLRDLAIQDDITDAAKWLVQTEVADANRIGIFFGEGYAAIAGVILSPGLYRDESRLDASPQALRPDKTITSLFAAYGQAGPSLPRAEVAETAAPPRAVREVTYMVKAGGQGDFKNTSDKVQFYHSMLRFFESNLTLIQD